MPGRVQKRYLWFTCIALSAVIVLLLIGVNAAMAGRIRTRDEGTLDAVMQYGDAPEQARAALDTEDAQKLAETSGKTPYEILRTTNYFTAFVASTGGAESLNMTHAILLTEDEAKILLQAAKQDETGPSGRVGKFAFLRENVDGGTRYAFADVSDSVLETVQLGTVSFALGSVGIACVLLFAWMSVLLWIRPMERNVDEGARLMQDAGKTLKTESGLSAQSAGIADGLLAASEVLASKNARKYVISLSALLSEACQGARPDVEKRGGTMTADVEPDIWVRCVPGEMQMMCELLLQSAARTMRPVDGEVRVDLLTDGRRVGIVVQSICTPWAEGEEPESADIAAVRLLARCSGGSAVFAPISPDALCTTIRLMAAQPPNSMRGGHL